MGRDITGRYQHPSGGVSPFTGTISGENTIDIIISGGGIRMTGPVIGTLMELTFKGGSADGMTLKFIPYSSY